MAVMKCRECGGQVSTQAAACPHCGAPTAHPRATPATAGTTKVSGWIGVAVVIATIWVIWSFMGGSNGPGTTTAVTAASTTTVRAQPSSDLQLQTCDSDNDVLQKASISEMSWQQASDLCTVMYGALAAYPTTAELHGFEQAVYVLKAKGYGKPERTIGLELMSFADDLGRMGSGPRLQSAFDDIVKIYEGTGAIVTPHDMIEILRPIGPEQASKLSDDGLFGMAAMVKEEKLRDGQ